MPRPEGRTVVGSPGDLLRRVVAGEATTRAELALATGLARSTISQRVDALVQQGWLVEAGEAPSTGGRRPTVLAFNRGAGIVLVADVGATHSRIAVADLAGTPLAETRGDLDVAAGPDPVLEWVLERFRELLEHVGRSERHVRGIGMGVPTPVEFATGRPVHPPIMPGWDNFAIPEWFRERLDVPVLVDNDVNIMAVGEHWSHWRNQENLLFIKVGTGIGCGIIAGGRIHRGAQGAAGDIGHVRVAGYEEILCECGNPGCLESIASGRALARQLTAMGIGAKNGRDVVKLVKAGNRDALRLVRDAGRLIGRVLSGAVNLLNPAIIVVGGDVAQADQHLLAGIREAVYERSTPLATRALKIEKNVLGDRAGIVGAAIMIGERLISPEVVDGALAADAGPGGR
ncbi:MAG TPA: ROK family transcriptional regulator [Actinomycetota bacterium]|nr:ROK family transcriptional regulator [Actinomycetota bacterium]